MFFIKSEKLIASLHVSLRNTLILNFWLLLVVWLMVVFVWIGLYSSSVLFRFSVFFVIIVSIVFVCSTMKLRNSTFSLSNLSMIVMNCDSHFISCRVTLPFDLYSFLHFLQANMVWSFLAPSICFLDKMCLFQFDNLEHDTSHVSQTKCCFAFGVFCGSKCFRVAICLDHSVNLPHLNRHNSQ